MTLREQSAGGGRCEVCHRREGHGWHADQRIWDAVMGKDGPGVICPICFGLKAELAGVEMAIVALTPEDYRGWLAEDDEGNPTAPAGWLR